VLTLLSVRSPPHPLLFSSLLLPSSSCHSQDFLNGVCTNIVHMHKKQLNYYTGNYDQYMQTRAELEENQMKQYKWEQEQIKHMKVRRWGRRAGVTATAVSWLRAVCNAPTCTGRVGCRMAAPDVAGWGS
jgi:hypothetical protein